MGNRAHIFAAALFMGLSGCGGSSSTQPSANTASNATTQFAIPSVGAAPTGIVAAPDGNLWFTDSGNIGKVTPAGAMSVYPIPGTDV
jgi:streptogramin lyase